MKFATITALLLATSPALAQVRSPLAMTTDPADRAVMGEVASAVASRPIDIVRLDAVLAKLPRPTPLRGMVQSMRAVALVRARDTGAAVAAVEEALRLLPDHPRPKLVAMGIFTFSGSPQRAADLWMQASRESPGMSRTTDRYVMMALVGRLREIGDPARADRVSARLGEIGFSAGLAPERSAAAVARTRDSVRSQRDSEALSSVTGISDPDDLLSLYVDRRFAMLWPRVAEWAAPDLSAQTMRYLEELRADWTAADSFETAVPYARQLSKLQAHEAVVGLFLPMFDRVQTGTEQKDVEFLAPVVARSLVQVGRAADAQVLLAKIAAVMADDAGGNALNIDGAYLTMAALATDWPQVTARADSFLARARSLGTEINRSATLDVEAWRACALSRAGRTEEAQRAAAEVLVTGTVAPNAAMQMHVCRGDVSAARTLVIERLADESTREWALRFVQPARADGATPLARLMEPVAQAVRGDPGVIAAANKVGRILPQPVNANVPTAFEPFRFQPRHRPLAPNAT